MSPLPEVSQGHIPSPGSKEITAVVAEFMCILSQYKAGGCDVVQLVPDLRKALVYILGEVGHTCPQEVEAGESDVQGHPQLHCESEDNLGYMRH